MAIASQLKIPMDFALSGDMTTVGRLDRFGKLWAHMSEIANQTLSDVSETLLIALYPRAMESQRPDALIKDEKAVALVARMSYDFDRIRQIPLSEANKVVIILRNREFDRYARDFLARHPQAVVVHIGCGLDSRFERVDNGLAGSAKRRTRWGAMRCLGFSPGDCRRVFREGRGVRRSAPLGQGRGRWVGRPGGEYHSCGGG